MVVVNDPYLGGTHLPDVTLIAPLFVDDQCVGFVANRAHHADIGASSPGSMPISRSLEEEGLLIAPTHLLRAGELQNEVMQRITSATRNPVAGQGDFAAQMSANHTGVKRMQSLVQQIGPDTYQQYLHALNDYAARLAHTALQAIPDGTYHFTDVMDDDGQKQESISIQVTITIEQGEIHVDFSGTADQVPGNINCPLSVAAAGVYYVFRCLMPPQTPACAGSFRHIHISAPVGCLLNAHRPAAVAAGNVETSTRVVDAVCGALARAIPDRIPAASHGSMNNVAMGSNAEPRWDYYETIGGGMGAGRDGGGLSGVQTHMTNTLNTPIESLEMHYPLRVVRYALRDDSGGKGTRPGGDGLVREFEFLGPTSVTLLTERRRTSPWGLAGGGAGQPGDNRLNGKPLPGKVSLQLQAGDRLCIATPGGGGYGKN
jgi:N-methylhydantoinase B